MLLPPHADRGSDPKGIRSILRPALATVLFVLMLMLMLMLMHHAATTDSVQVQCWLTFVKDNNTLDIHKFIIRCLKPAHPGHTI